MEITKTLNLSKRVVVKVGSSLLTNMNSGIRRSVLDNIVGDISWLIKKNKEVIIVSSGAIAIGKGILSFKKELSLNESQAVAARGQIELITAWKNEFRKHKLQVAQILLTPSDTENKKTSDNAVATIENLISFKCIPIINENDTTSTDEIKFGDNDILASKISKLIKADHLILLSNVDGLYKEPPRNKKNGVLISEIKSITKSIRDMAGTASRLGKGGMISKIKAAEICMKSKCSLIITSGLKKDPIKSLARKTSKSTRFIST